MASAAVCVRFRARRARERQEEEAELALQLLAAKKRPPTMQELVAQSPGAASGGGASSSRFARTLQRDQLCPLVDLAYSESPSVQRSAIGLLATLSINADNKDMFPARGWALSVMSTKNSTAIIS